MFIKTLSKITRPNIRYLSATNSTIDQKEVKHFEKFHSWWDVNSEVKPLLAMNRLRVPFIRDNLINNGKIDKKFIGTPKPLNGLNIIDVGCGGGFLAEPLARLGGNVTGIDASDLINVAKQHSKQDSTLTNLSYFQTSIEEHAVGNTGKYDLAVSSEVIEHVTNKEQFLKSMVECVKPGGSIVITTVSQTTAALIGVIYVAEDLIRILPKGTHEYNKFITPHKLQRILEENNCTTKVVHGMLYNPLVNKWCWIENTSVSYALHAIKN